MHNGRGRKYGMIEVTDNPARSRYELRIDGDLVGIADYRVDGNVVVLPHTEINRDRRGRGLGAVLVKGALDDVRAQGRTVVPRCWYVAEFIEKNASYADLLAA
jgi:predicted GNAT family acetyltransferase